MTLNNLLSRRKHCGLIIIRNNGYGVDELLFIAYDVIIVLLDELNDKRKNDDSRGENIDGVSMDSNERANSENEKGRPGIMRNIFLSGNIIVTSSAAEMIYIKSFSF